MQTVLVALSAGDRVEEELTSTLCKALRVTQEQVKQAYDRLGVQQLIQQGHKTMLRRPSNPQIPASARQNDAQPATTESRTESSGSQAEDQTEKRGNWLDGPARGTGDVIRERRG
jgi:hypothetical protein